MLNCLHNCYFSPHLSIFRQTKIISTALQECDLSLKHKSELIDRLEMKTTAMTDTLQKLDNK